MRKRPREGILNTALHFLLIRGFIMELWSELLGSWGGILSLLVILFMVGMAGFIGWFLKSRG